MAEKIFEYKDIVFARLPPMVPSAGLSLPDVFLVERLSDWDWYEMQSMSGCRLRFGVGVGAVGVMAEMSLRAGWLSVDWGVGGLCPKGLGLRSRWALQAQIKRKGTIINSQRQWVFPETQCQR